MFRARRTRAREILARWAAAPWMPYLLILAAPFAGHLASYLTGLSDNPLILNSGAVLGGTSILPGSPFTDANIGWTNQALGHLAARDWLHGIIPWWNPDSGIGLPLAGEMQPAALFLPFVLLLIFPSGLLWLMGVLQALSAFACFHLLKRLDLSRTATLVGALLFEFNGTFASVPGETILNVIPFLPILLLGIEYARDRRGTIPAFLLVAIGIGWSLLGGFPETAFIDGLFALVWIAARYPGAKRPFAYPLRIAAGGLVGLMIAAPGLVAFLDYATLSGAFDHHLVGGITVDYHGLATILLPYVFGLNGDNMGSGWMESFLDGTAGYIMLALLPFAFAGLISRRLPILQAALAGWIILSLAKIFGVPPAMALFGAIPFMKEVMFYRYSAPAWELAAIVLAMIGFDDCRAHRRLRIPLLLTLLIFLATLAIASPWSPGFRWSPAARITMEQRFAAAAGFGALGLAALGLIERFLHPNRRPIAFATVLVVNALLLFNLPQLAGMRGARVDWPAIRYLHRHIGLGRFYTTGPITPNYAVYFDLASINDNYLPVADNWADYVGHDLLPEAAIYHANIFWPPFPPMSTQTALHDIITRTAAYRAIGVDYVVTPPGATFQPLIEQPASLANGLGLVLNPGDHLTMTAKAPATLTTPTPISNIAVSIATFSGAADGDLVLKLCAAGICGSGARNLRDQHDNSPAWVVLDHPVLLHAGDPYTLEIIHRGGHHANVVWLPPRGRHDVTLSSNTTQTITGRMPQILFATGPTPHDLTPVYADSIMEIWHLTGARPYYRTTGSACTLTALHPDSVTALCREPATLQRQQLFMPGWHARVNGHKLAIQPSDTIMQSIPLPPGRSTITFHFAPPHITLAWIAFWLGTAALALATLLATRKRPNQPPIPR
jgi:hypothetical protein